MQLGCALRRAGGLNQKLIQQAEPTVSPGRCGIERRPGTAGFVVQPAPLESPRRVIGPTTRIHHSASRPNRGA